METHPALRTILFESALFIATLLQTNLQSMMIKAKFFDKVPRHFSKKYIKKKKCLYWRPKPKTDEEIFTIFFDDFLPKFRIFSIKH